MKGIIRINGDIPLIGTLMFGLIDRGTNLIQIRPTSVCPLNCIYCSTSSGPFSKYHINDYIVDIDYLTEWIKSIVEYKGGNVEANLDSVGEPLTYKNIVELVRKLREMKGISVISMQTNGVLLTKKLVDDLEDAGIDRINLSINTFDKEKARYMSGQPWYNLDKIIDMARYISKTRIHLLIAPVIVPGINDNDIDDLIKFAIELNKNKNPKWPIIGLQKFEEYRFGRKPKGVKEISYWKFYNQLKGLEKKYNIKLILSKKDFGIHKVKEVPRKFNVYEKVKLKVMLPGWMKNQVVAVGRNRCVNVINFKQDFEEMKGRMINVKILRNKDNIYVGEMY